MKYWLVLFFLLSAAATASAAASGDFENLSVLIMPRPHQDLNGYPVGLSDSYYFTKTASRIFLQDKELEVKIIDTDIYTHKACFRLKHSKYGEGTLTLFSDLDLKEVSAEALKQALNATLSDKLVSLVVVDKSAKTYHVATCNHLPPETSREYAAKSSAESAGFRKCGVCFYDQLNLPDYRTELAIQRKGSAELRHFNEHSRDAGTQTRVEALGTRILEGWPYPLLGYNYKFQVVESREINAFALAAGSVFVTTGLLNAIESDDELQAVLAHEIAHVERRHGLQSYQQMVADQQTQLALQILGGVAAGVAGANSQPRIAGVIGGVTLAGILAVKLQHQGYSKEQEKEADEFAVRYFTKNGKSLDPLKSVFKKLMYHNLCSGQDPDPESSSHPALGSRIALLAGNTTVFVRDPYHFFYKGNPLEITFLSTSTCRDSSQVLVQVSDLDAFKKWLNEVRTIRVSSGAKSYDFEVDSGYVSTDPWGGMVTLHSKIAFPTLPVFDSVGGTVYINFNSGKLSTSSDTNAYPEVRVLPFIRGAYY